MIDAELCGEKIRWVAGSFHNLEEFRSRAKVAADDLGPESIETLSILFHREGSPPAKIADQFPGLSDWIVASQFAIFEIFYYLRDDALPVLRRVAHGEYDSLSANFLRRCRAWCGRIFRRPLAWADCHSAVLIFLRLKRARLVRVFSIQSTMS